MVEHRSVIEIQISRIISRQISLFDGTGKNFPRIIEIIDSRQCRFLGKFYFSLETLAKFPNNGIFVPSSNSFLGKFSQIIFQKSSKSIFLEKFLDIFLILEYPSIVEAQERRLEGKKNRKFLFSPRKSWINFRKQNIV